MEDIPPIPPDQPPITSRTSTDTDSIPSETVLLEEWQVSGDGTTTHGWSDHHQIETEEERNRHPTTNGPPDGTTTHGWSDHHQIESEEERNRHPTTNGPPSPVQLIQLQPPHNLPMFAAGSERSTSGGYLVENSVETDAGNAHVNPESNRPEQNPSEGFGDDTFHAPQTSPNQPTSPSRIALPPGPLPIHSSSWAPNLHRAAEQTLAAASKRRWN
eukprot:CAMPEP_0171323246 /NCGR_PEP_ID=MMETSP0816-20121228/115460_1 /TAXON_ID=420281 /ORGANISM="Proboscia inermis, Strain CCAP1064/1" /LENGTH=214 /DNA_ID=CAMNT_0011821915 /DNA_START=184 /DNA_END=828 /DNA_ORIENTATION=-